MGVNCDQISGLRIAGFLSALAGSDFEGAETAQLDDLLFLKAGLDLFEELIDDLMDVASVYAKFVMKVLDDNCCFWPSRPWTAGWVSY